MPTINSPNSPSYVYIIGSPGSSAKTPYKTYVGWTTDLERRLTEHNGEGGGKSGAKSTRGRKWVLLYSEEFPTRSEAMSREWHLKRDKAFRKSLIPA